MKAIVTLLLAAVTLAGCDQNMESQPKYGEYAKAPLFRSGAGRDPPAGTMARDALEKKQDADQRPALTAALLDRGHQRFTIFCLPCHGAGGDGNGRIVQRGMPSPTSYHDPRLVSADDQHFFDVITDGYGAMYSYASRVSPRDRWAIIAYIRALQLSRRASLEDIPPEERARLTAMP